MHISEKYLGKSGVTYIFEYQDCNDFSILPYDQCRQCYGVCFTGNNQIVIGFGGKKQAWGLIGGTIEFGESFEQTLRREIQEESNMEILDFKPIGYQKMTDIRDGSFVYQLRFMCNVRPFGPFIEDPAGTILEIKEIEIGEYKNYFDWGVIGERIIQRALEVRQIDL